MEYFNTYIGHMEHTKYLYVQNLIFLQFYLNLHMPKNLLIPAGFLAIL